MRLERQTVIEARHGLDSPCVAAQVQTHEQLRSGLDRTKRSGRWRRVLRSPYRSVRQRLGLPVETDWQKEFVTYPGWPEHVREALQKLPGDFITIASIQPDIACQLYETIRNGRCEGILECGSGVSSAIIAMALGNRPAKFVSLEESEFWIARTRHALELLGLLGRVELIHAPLKSLQFDGRTVQAHDDSAVKGLKADLLLVDAPPAEVGRIGVLPRMARFLNPGALVLLDDAGRLGEEKCVEAWTRNGLASLEGYLALGTGLAILRKR